MHRRLVEQVNCLEFCPRCHEHFKLKKVTVTFDIVTANSSPIASS